MRGSADGLAESGPQLWCAPLDLPASALGALTSCVDEEERGRASRYRRAIDRDRFLAARGWLRHLLAAEMGATPREVLVEYARGGKPRLGDSDLRFSLARSGGAALFGLSWGAEIGVDIEAVRTDADVDDIARRFFAPQELAALASLPDQERLEASFQCWTRKEAYVKGLGVGVGVPLDTFDVWGDGSSPVALDRWRIHRVEVARGFAAAVAVDGLDDWSPAAPGALRSPATDGPAGSIER